MLVSLRLKLLRFSAGVFMVVKRGLNPKCNYPMGTSYFAFQGEVVDSHKLNPG
jgi:hypothetical protein